MKIFHVLTFAGFTSLLLQSNAIAQTAPNIGNLTPSQIQLITPGLYPFSSREFFRQGQDKLEQEVQALQQQRLRRSLRDIKVDKIDVQRDLQKLEQIKSDASSNWSM
ncbi:hypothetical protein NIES4071_30280 [Calothrix sp. NIES-4071]|nr:hypothetical protein NIES4071_30280 [Calothrix sp. NIES-4071]BAZ57348.1 hypothetical protein NIES4105_30220 [Calothrix sp. NIES-4105]